MASASASKKEQRLQMFPNSPKPGASKPLRDDRDFDETSILWHAQKRERAVERGQANSALCSNMQLNAGIVGNTATVLLNVQIDDSAMAGIGSHIWSGVLKPLGRAGRLEKQRLEPAGLRMERSMAYSGFFLIFQPGPSDTARASTRSSFRTGSSSDISSHQGGVC